MLYGIVSLDASLRSFIEDYGTLQAIYDVAMALVEYQYRAKADNAPFSTWLTYVFQLQEGQWRIIRDHNTALGYAAFARAVGIEVK